MWLYIAVRVVTNIVVAGHVNIAIRVIDSRIRRVIVGGGTVRGAPRPMILMDLIPIVPLTGNCCHLTTLTLAHMTVMMTSLTRSSMINIIMISVILGVVPTDPVVPLPHVDDIPVGVILRNKYWFSVALLINIRAINNPMNICPSQDRHININTANTAVLTR